MKLSYLALLGAVGLLACGNSTTGDDAGGGDAATDAAADGTSNDAAGGDSSTDSSADAAGDGGLQQGDTCDTQNDQCGPGLLCCGGGALLPDASSTTGHCIARPDSGKCPAVP